MTWVRRETNLGARKGGRMRRRMFLRSMAGGAGAMLLSRAGVAGAASAKADRIGATAVSFRLRFPSTRPKGVEAAEPDLALLDAPALFVECWAPKYVPPDPFKAIRSVAETIRACL